MNTTNGGTGVVDIQRGTVLSSSSGQLTVHSADGFTAIYTVNSTNVFHHRSHRPAAGKRSASQSHVPVRQAYRRTALVLKDN